MTQVEGESGERIEKKIEKILHKARDRSWVDKCDKKKRLKYIPK